MTTSSARLAAAVLGIAICLAIRPSAQQPAPPANQPQATFRSGIDSISVDAIVTDKQGRPVTNLTQQDFEIREGGKPQTVETFRFVQIEDGFDDPSAQRDILSSADHDIEVAKETNRLLVIFLDDYHVRMENSMAFREKLAAFVSQLAPHDLVALTLPLDPASAITFSRNHEAIAGQIMNFTGRKYDYRPKYPLEFRYIGESPPVLERMRNQWTIAGLRSLCEYMGSYRVGRKTILYVSEGMSNTFPAGVKTIGSDFSSFPEAGPDPTGRLLNRQIMDSMELVSDLERVFSAAARSNTAIYTMDPRGLAASEYSLADNVSSGQDKFLLTQTTEMLRTIAEQTDGRAIVNRNDPIPSLKQMVRDNSSYYLLGYTSSSQYRDGKFHEIQVRVKQRDLEVRARKGYWAVSAEELAKASAPKAVVRADVTDALDSMANVTEAGRRQPVTVWMGANRGSGEKATVTFVWEAGAVDGRQPTERAHHLAIEAFSIYGDALFKGRLDPDPAAATPGGVVKFDAPPGSLTVKVEVQNASGRRLETTEATLDVPDFTSTAATISTPFVFKGRTVRELQAIRAAENPMPTTARAFSRTERVLFRFDAYGPGGVAPTVTIKVLNQNGGSVASMPPPTRTTGNTFESEFSLGPFPPSDYVIEISADANGDVTRRLVGIRVTG